MNESSENKVKVTLNREFNEEIIQCIRAGFGITPFIGSGCSSSSGIMMGQDFTNYLGYTVYRCVSKDQTEKRWQLASQGWPEPPNHTQIDQAKGWAEEIFERMGDHYGVREDSTSQSSSPETIHGNLSPFGLLKKLAPPNIPDFLQKPGIDKDAEISQSLRELIFKNSDYLSRQSHSQKSPTSYASICEQAIDSLCDWRATLKFLSSLRQSSSSDQLGLSKPDPSIIDRFNFFITKNRRPNLIHSMLAQLSLSCRTRLLLTTNFDNLIETAFEELNRELAVVPVGINDPLPHPDLIHERDCLIKLHGDCHQTRADFSLDEPPAPIDKERFFSYVRGTWPNFQERSKWGPGLTPSQLVVMGYSGRDIRCNQLLKYVLDCDPEAKIFWVCHSQRDHDRVSALFAHEGYGEDRVVTTISEQTDLLLYDLFQRLNLTLPSAGQSYQFAEENIPSSSPGVSKSDDPASGDSSVGNVSSDEDDFKNQIEAWLKKRALEKEITVTTVVGAAGVINQLSTYFDSKSSERAHRIWIEMDDYPDALSIGDDILTSLSMRNGSFPLKHKKPLPTAITNAEPGEDLKSNMVTPSTQAESWKRYFQESCSELGISPTQCLIGFYGRNGPGGCSGWEENKYWEKKDYSSFWDLIYGLASIGIQVIYAPFDVSRVAVENEKRIDLSKSLSTNPELKKEAENAFAITADPFIKRPRFHSDTLAVDICTINIGEESDYVKIRGELEHFLKPPDVNPSDKGHDDYEEVRCWKRNFTALHSATLFRQSRHFSAFLNEALFRCPKRFNSHCIDNDEKRVKEVSKWLKKLTGIKVFHEKLGGFSWSYRDIRHTAFFLTAMGKKYSEGGKKYSEKGEKTILLDRYSIASRSHYFIAEWYEKAHRVTKHPTVLGEAIYHNYQAAIYSDRADSPKHKTGNNAYKQHCLIRALVALHRVLRSGRRTLKYWYSEKRIENFFTEYEKLSVALTPQIESCLAKKDPDEVPDDGSDKKFEKLFRSQAEHLIGRIDEECRFQKPTPKGSFKKLPNYPLSSENSPSSEDMFPLVYSHLFREEHTMTWIGKIQNELENYVNNAHKRSEIVSWIIDTLNNFFQNNQERRVLSGYANNSFFKYIRQHISNPEKLLQAAIDSIELGFLFHRRAELQSYLTPDEDLSKFYISSCLLNSTALNLVKLVTSDESHEPSNLEAKASSLYGVALGHLGRYREARRRITEARAITRSMEADSRYTNVLLGITALRRAQIDLLEAKQIELVSGLIVDSFTLQGAFDLRTIQKKQLEIQEVDLKRIHSVGEAQKSILRKYGLCLTDDRLKPAVEDEDSGVSLADRLRSAIIKQQSILSDSWHHLEEARRAFTGRTHSRRWWKTLYILELSCFSSALRVQVYADGLEAAGLAGVRFRMLMCRARRDNNALMSELWRRAIEVSGDGLPTGEEADSLEIVEQIFGRLRATEAYLDCIIAFPRSLLETDNAETIVKVFSKKHPTLNTSEQIKRINSVGKFLNKEGEVINQLGENSDGTRVITLLFKKLVRHQRALKKYLKSGSG